MNDGLTVLGLCGYDFRNVGDDAFMLVLADQVARVGGGREVRVTSSYLPREARSLPVRPLYRGMSQVRGAHLWRLWRGARGADALVLFGGSVLHEDCHYWRERLKLAALKRTTRGIRCGAIGVSIGPIISRAQRRRLVAYLNDMDFITVRDEQSLAFLHDENCLTPAEYQFDLAALLLDMPRRERQKSADKSDNHVTVGIAPCGTALNGPRLAVIAEAIIRLNKCYPVRLKLFEFNGHKRHGDGTAVEMLRSGLSSICPCDVVRYRPDPLGFMNEIATCDALLAMRLHSAVFGFLSEVPLAMLSYHTKCDGFANSIGMSLAHHLNVNQFDPIELTVALMDLVENGPLPALKVENAVASARRHFEPLLARKAA